MDPIRFDSLTRSLGEARSRRGVLKTLGAGALGALGLAAFNGATVAAPGGNSACAAFCHTVFGDTRAAGQCTSEAARGLEDGLCAACGADPDNYCDGACTDVTTDTGNCGTCGNVCSPLDNGTATCTDGTCMSSCDDGFILGSDGSCLASCANAVLSDTANGIGQICADDHYTIAINSIQIYDSPAHFLDCVETVHGPVPLGTVTQGDQIHVVANNSSDNCGGIALPPLYLVCLDTGASQTLDTTGIPVGGIAPCGAVFYDQTFTADF